MKTVNESDLYWLKVLIRQHKAATVIYCALLSVSFTMLLHGVLNPLIYNQDNYILILTMMLVVFIIVLAINQNELISLQTEELEMKNT